MRHRPPTLLIGLVAAAFFFAPAFAWVSGERATPIENRPLVAFPSLDLGWDVFPALTQWTTDYLPLRSNAVRFNTRLSERVFNEAPAQIAATGPVGVGQAPTLAGQANAGSDEPAPKSKVLRGEHGWLYLTQDFTSGCEPEWSMAEVLRGLRRLDSIIGRSGRRLIVVVPPDKSTIERAEIPDDYALRGCAERAHRARIAALRRLALPSVVDMQAVLEARRRRQRSPIYLSLDSHWTQVGSYLYGRSLVEKIDPRLLRHTRVVPGARQTPYGDLTTLIGDPKRVNQPGLRLERDGVSAPRTTETSLYPGGVVTRERRSAATGLARLYPYRAVLHGSSFTRVSADKVKPYFADITLPPQLLDAESEGRLAQAEQLLLDLIKSSKLLILEQVEREFWGVQTGSLLRPEFLDRLERALSSP
jgi:alginate O-acetyltransferase complex protein AlgJ